MTKGSYFRLLQIKTLNRIFFFSALLIFTIPASIYDTGFNKILPVMLSIIFALVIILLVVSMMLGGVFKPPKRRILVSFSPKMHFLGSGNLD